MPYDQSSRARFFPDSPKTSGVAGSTERRSPFARDRARVLHSAALRRLAGKTQVVGPGEGDVPRTRLTHSIEVAQIGRGIATELGTDPDVVDTAGLAHDIGHPPFGHNGEQALNEAAAACGGFEGNAQTLRILTRLEPKLLDDAGHSLGLNLTRASLDAATKYPWPKRPGLAKFGVYDDDREVFDWIREAAPTGKQCLEAQIMDWSDDVAYSVHDVEDGVIAGRISLASLKDPGERRAIAEAAARQFSGESAQALEETAAGLLTLPVVATLAGGAYDGSIRAQATLKGLTSELVGRFAGAVVAATLGRYPADQLMRYGADLVIPPNVAAEVAVLKAVALRYIMSDEKRLKVQQGQRELLHELLDHLRKNPQHLDEVFAPQHESAETDAQRLRIVIDQVATFTDSQAIRLHHKLVRA